MGTMTGADADALDLLAARLDGSAGWMQGAQGRLSRSIHAVPWHGNNAERFRQHWDTDYRRAMLDASKFLRDAGAVLRRNADQQRHASSAASGHGGRGPSHLVGQRPVRRDLPDPHLDGHGEYVDRSGEQLFGDDDLPSVSDVRQTELGDCWLMAVLASVASVDPERIRRLVTDNGDGTYTVHFHDRDVTVDGELSTATAGSALWVAIVEKAYAKYAGDGYEDIVGDHQERAFHDLFGADVKTFDPDSTHWFGNVSPDDAAKEMRRALDHGHPVTCTVRGTMGIKGGHALSVLRVTDNTITVRNPWGDNDSIRAKIEAAGGKILSGGRIQFSNQEFADIFEDVQIVTSW